MPEPASAQADSGLHLRRLGGATLLFMSAVMLSRVIGYLREAYIAYAFGAGPNTDAYFTAFRIPDFLNYLIAGGSLSITFITIFSPFLAQKREQEGYRAFSSIVTFIALLLTVGVAATEIWTPQILRWYVPEFTPPQMAECIFMTRILLPAQLFFCVGGLLSAVLYARGKFLIPAAAPLLYSLSIIAGGLLLGHRLGIVSLAVGAVAGALIGPFLLPLAGAAHSGLRYRIRLDFRDPHFRRWIALTLPLMIGVSLTTADDWIIGKLAAHLQGAISLLTYAKRLFGVPIAVLGQAVGQASMPFFARLAGEGKWDELRATLDRSVVRTVTTAMLFSSLLASIALPVVRLLYQRGRFGDQDSRSTAAFFLIFVLSLIFWSAQSLYSRAFYAAGNTMTPMLAGSIITAAMIPLYHWLYLRLGVSGLAVASDLGITVLTLAMAILLHRRGWLGMSRERWRHVPRVIAVALVAGGAGFVAAHRLEPAHYRAVSEMGITAASVLVWLASAVMAAYLLGLRDLVREYRAIPARLLKRF